MSTPLFKTHAGSQPPQVIMYTMTTLRNSFFISGAVIALIIIAPLMALAAWSEPTQAPPGGNVDPPINTGSGNQVKNGGLSVTGFAVFGSTSLNGNTYLKTGVTGSIYRYLNFGANYDVNGNVIASTIGASGYGIRDKDGTLEFKNSGGSWASIQDTVNTLAGMWVTSGNNIYNTNSGNIGVGVSSPNAKLDVNGEVKFGNSGSACGSSIEGQQRYNYTSHNMEYCNGTDWVSFVSNYRSLSTYHACGSTNICTATCPTGMKAVGGDCSNIAAIALVTAGIPPGSSNTYRCSYMSASALISVNVVCVH